MGDSSSNATVQWEREKMYTKPGWIPVTTEMNDPSPMRPPMNLLPEILREVELTHEDWCEDKTCLHRERP